MKRLFALMLLAQTPFALAATETATADIATLSWAAGNRDALNASPGLPRQAEALLARLLPDADLIAPSVGESRFVDVDGNGTLELVSTVDYSGRAFYTHVVVVQKRQGRLTWSEVAGNGVSLTDLSRHLLDADGNGTLELVTERYIDRYEGAERAPKETLVFRWTGDAFVEDSDAFPGYYREHVIPALEKQLRQLTGQPSSAAQPRNEYETFTVRTELERARRQGKVK